MPKKKQKKQNNEETAEQQVEPVLKNEKVIEEDGVMHELKVDHKYQVGLRHKIKGNKNHNMMVLAAGKEQNFWFNQV